MYTDVYIFVCKIHAAFAKHGPVLFVVTSFKVLGHCHVICDLQIQTALAVPWELSWEY